MDPDGKAVALGACLFIGCISLILVTGAIATNPPPFPLEPVNNLNNGGIVKDNLTVPRTTVFPQLKFTKQLLTTIFLLNLSIGTLFSKKTNTSDIPSQGTVNGGIEDAPEVDAGKQGKHVKGHPNYNPNSGKSTWANNTSGVPETQQGWLEGEELPDGTRVWDSGEILGTEGQTGVRVHIDGKGNIHGYPVDPKQYLGD